MFILSLCRGHLKFLSSTKSVPVADLHFLDPCKDLEVQMAENRVVVESLKWAIQWAPSHQQRSLCNCSYLIQWVCFMADQDAECSTVTVIWDFWSVRKMFHFDGYLRFLISAKNVPLWRLFEVSDQWEECSTVTGIWSFWSVRRIFHCGGYLRFLISAKNVPLWLLFEVSDQYEECSTLTVI